MIDDILPYVNSYDDVRAALGVPDEELKDAVLALALYRNTLGMALNSFTGEYPAEAGDRTLLEIFADLDATDPMHVEIQMYSTYLVADTAAGALPMFGVKTKSDGKSVVTRHSAESTYMSTKKNIKEQLQKYVGNIRDLFTAELTESDLLVAVAPVVDPVLGE